MPETSFLYQFISAGAQEGNALHLRRVTLINILLLVLTGVFFAFSVHNLFFGSFSLFLIDIFGLLSCGGLIYLVQKKNQLELAINTCLIITSATLLLVVSQVMREDYGLVLQIFFPVMFIMLKGRNEGLAWAGVFYALLFLGVWFNLQSADDIVWQQRTIIRFISSAAFLLGAVYFYELSYERTLTQLSRISALEKIHNEELHTLAITDSLTGLYNRRHFDQVFAQHINHSNRQQELLTFFIIDADNFKRYNDIYGHQSGDHVLRKISECIQEHLRRKQDIAFRIGGEEFAGLLHTADEQQALALVNNIRQGIEDLALEHSGNTASPVVTVSAGIIYTQGSSMENTETLYHKADTALYKAKSQGRNRVIVYHNQLAGDHPETAS